MWSFLLAAVGPLAIRVLITLGFTAVTFTGMNAAFQGLVSMAQSSWGSLPSAVLGLAGLMGVPACLGLVFGALGARVTMWIAASATRIITTGGS